MALSVKTGSFARPAAGTTNSVVTGLGFAPTCVLFLASNAITGDVWRSGVETVVGWAAPPVGEATTILAKSAALAHTHGVAPVGRTKITGALSQINPAGTVQAESATITFQADGFTINWLDAPYDGEAELIAYMAFGGDAQAATGSVASLPSGLAQQIYHPVGFQPTAALMLTQFGVEAQSIGVMAGAQQWALASAIQQGVATSDNYRHLESGSLAYLIDPQRSGATLFDMRGSALSPNGFELTTDFHGLRPTLSNLNTGTFNNLTLKNPGQIAIDSTGRVLIADTGNNRLVRINGTTGAYIDSITGLPGITGVCVDATDNIYVTHRGGTNATHAKYTSALGLVWSVTPGPVGRHLATDGTHLYISREGIGSITKVLCSTGAFVAALGTNGSADGQLHATGTWGIAYGGGELYVMDVGNLRIQVLDPVAGAFKRKWSNGLAAASRGLAYSAGRVFYTTASGAGANGYIQLQTTTGGVDATGNSLAGQTFLTGNLYTGVAVGAGDVLWVGNADAGVLTKWDEVASAWVRQQEILSIYGPGQVAVEANGQVLIADTGNRRLLRLSPEGWYVQQFANVVGITGVCVDAAGDIYFSYATAGAGTIRKVSPNFATLKTSSAVVGASFRHVTTDGISVWSVGSNGLIYRFNASTLIAEGSFGTVGSDSADGRFNNAIGIVTDGAHLYIADYGNTRVQKFTLAGEFVTKWTSIVAVGLALDAYGNIVHAVYGGNSVQWRTNTGGMLASITVTSPYGVGLTSSGDLWLTHGDASGASKWTRVPAPSAEILYLGNILANCGFAGKPTGVAPASHTISTGVRAKAALFAMTGEVSASVTYPHTRFSLGFTDGVNHRAIAAQIQDNAVAPNASNVFSASRVLIKANNVTSTVEASATATITTGSLSLTWNPNDAISAEMAWLVFGEMGPRLSGAAVLEVGSTVDFAYLGAQHRFTGQAFLGVAHPTQPIWLGSSSMGTAVLGTIPAQLAVGSQGMPWTPKMLGSKLKGWYRADTITGVADGATLAAWNDESGSGNHGVQTIEADKPLYRTNQINGKPAVEFVSIDTIRMPVLGSTYLESIVAMVDVDTFNVTGTIVGPGATGVGGNFGRQFRYSGGNVLQMVNEGVAAMFSGSIGVPQNVPTIVSFRGTATTLALGVNGVMETGTHTMPVPTSGTTRNSHIGNRSDGLHPFDGVIPELIITQPAMTLEEHQLCDGYLAHKYGRAASLPSTHPYRYFPPSGITHLKIDHTNMLSSMHYDAFGNEVIDPIAVLTDHYWLPSTHALTGKPAAIPLNTNKAHPVTIGAALDGVATLTIAALLSKLRTATRFRGAALIDVGGDEIRLSGAPLPEPAPVVNTGLGGLGASTVGTVNLFRNPDFEIDTVDASAIGATTLSRYDAMAWHGTSSLRAILPNAVNAGVRFQTLRGLPYVGMQYGFLSQFHLRAAADITQTMQAFSRLRYTDGTTTTGPLVQWGPTLSTTWRRVDIPVVVSNPTKQVDWVEVDVIRPLAVAGQTIYIDGVQIELDRGQGHTPWAVGSYGLPYHRWVGAGQASLTVREPVPADFSTKGISGQYKIEAFLYKADANNNLSTDLSDYVVSASVTADAERDISWTLQCRMLAEGWAHLEPWEDWLAPYMKVTLPDGRVRQGQLGHFVVLPSPRDVGEYDETVDIDARSGEILLQLQGTRGILQVKEGTAFRHAMKVILDNCHLGVDDNNKFRYDLPDPEHVDRAKRTILWEKKQDVNRVLNDLSHKAGWYPVYMNKIGLLTTNNRKKRRLNRINPVRVFAANLPSDVADDPWVHRSDATDNEVVGRVKIIPRVKGVEDNTIVVVSVDPNKPRIKTKRKINSPDHPNSHNKKKRKKERKVEMDIHTQADAEDLAEAIAEEVSIQIDTVTLSVIPDPQTEFMRNVVYLAVYNAFGDPVAVGRYSVMRVVYGFTHDEAMMEMTLGFVHSVEELTSTAEEEEWDDETIWNPFG